MKTKYKYLLAISTLAITAANSQAAFSLIDDMDSGNNWLSDATAPTSAGIVADPADAGNNVFAITNTNSDATNADSYLSLGGGIANNTTGTLFFRVRTTGDGGGLFDWVFGASDVAAPGDWAHYEGYGAMNSDGGATTDLNVRAGGGFDYFGDVTVDTWYNIWFVLNNTTDTTTMYFTTGSTDATTPIASATGAFRNGTADALTTLLVRNNQLNTSGYIDDVYLDTTGANLANPVPEPSTGLLGALGALALLRRRRK